MGRAVKCADPFSCLFKRIHILVDVHILTFHFVLRQISDGFQVCTPRREMRTQPELSNEKKKKTTLVNNTSFDAYMLLN